MFTAGFREAKLYLNGRDGMPENVKLRLVTIVLVFAGCAIAFLFWKDSAPVPAGVALLGAAAAEIAFWARLWRRTG